MLKMLTKKQREMVKWLGEQKASIKLYESDSINGLSWTLRYKKEWADPGASYPRSESHMIFSILKPEDATQDAKVYAEKMRPRVQEARQIFEDAKNGCHQTLGCGVTCAHTY